MFSLLYFVATFLIVPNIAPFFGRERINESDHLRSHSFFYKLANRNYVKPELNQVLENVADDFFKNTNGIELVYLDANFPFMDQFPLLPHLSHNDGKKIDLSFVYKDDSGALTQQKPSMSGYGVYEASTSTEYNQNDICKKQGYWQYDFTKYVSFGRLNKDISLSEKGTRDLINLILEQKDVAKLFIEPHLKTRLNLANQKIRFHGCQAVRHDDHIHFQIH